MADSKDSAQPQKSVERLIFRDELTDVFNRRYLFQYLPQEISRCKNLNQNVWVFMMDIDDFKSINDKYGHLRGDEVLKAVADVLKQCVRTEDTVIRYAGDEFTIVLPGADVSSVNAIAKRINSTISQSSIKSSVPGQPDISVNLSIGIANFPDDAEDAVRVIDLADKALYVSKQKGKNRISFVSDISAEIIRAKEILQIFPCPKLIERDQIMQKLSQVYDNISKENKTKLILISSDVGLGKSRLLDEFSKAMEKRGITLFIKCSERLLTQPYRTLMVSLESYLKTAAINKDRLLNNLTPEQLAVLSGMLPSLKDKFGLADLTSSKNVEDIEFYIESGLKQLIVNLASGNRLVLVFDDFQWIDEDTLKLIFILKKAAASAVLILGGFRKNAEVLESADYPVNRLKDDIEQTIDEEIVLEHLSYAATREMISSIFVNMERSEKLDSLIHKVTKGNPLFIEELFKFLIQRGFIYYQKGNWGKVEIQESDIPKSLEEVILERFKSLDKTTQELISKAAVIGQDFNVELLHRFGKQDEGYILDILDSAQRAGIIKKSRATLKEDRLGGELSFVSDEIRRVLYGMIEQDKIKDLHKQVGEIEEGLYADNLDQIAGELFYHFKKAEDYHRAKVYADKVKAAQVRVYDTALKYAQKILEGVEEKRVAPLSKKSLELSVGIIRQLYILNINTMLYPAGSSMVTVPTEDSFNKLSEIFVRDEALCFNHVKGALLVNGQRLKGGQLKGMFEESFLNFLKSSHIDSITFKRGLTKTAFVEFINILTHHSEDKTLAEQLKEKGIYQILIQHISYEMATAAEKTQERERLEENMLLEYLLGKISGVDKAAGGQIDWDSRAAEAAKVISQMAQKAGEGADKEDATLKDSAKASLVQDTFQKMGSQLLDKNPQDWDKYKKSLAKTIMNLEPNLRREVLLSNKPEGGPDKKDIIKEIANEFPDEVIVDFLSDEFKEQKSSGAKMRGLVQKLLSDEEQRQRVAPMIKDKLARLGLPKEELSWVFGEQTWKDFSLEEKTKRFLEMSAEEYINLEDEVGINILIADVLNDDRQDLFNSILNKWKEFLKVDSDDLRKRISINFLHIIESIPVSRPELLIILLDIVFSRLEAERVLEIYASLARGVISPLGYLIDSENFIHAKIILENLNKEKTLVKNSPDRYKFIQELWEKIFTPERLKLITAELIKRIDNASYYEDIKDLILDIAEDMVKPLIDEAMIEDKVLGYLGYFGAYLRRRGIGEMLKALTNRYGQDSVIDELKVRLDDKEWYIVKNTIELFLYLHDHELVKLLENCLKNPNVIIRKKAVFVLNRIGGEQSIKLLIEALKDSDNSIRLSVIQSLSKIGNKSVLMALKNSYQPDLQSELKMAIESVEKLLGKDLKRE